MRRRCDGGGAARLLIGAVTSAGRSRGDVLIGGGNAVSPSPSQEERQEMYAVVPHVSAYEADGIAPEGGGTPAQAACADSPID